MNIISLASFVWNTRFVYVRQRKQIRNNSKELTRQVVNVGETGITFLLSLTFNQPLNIIFLFYFIIFFKECKSIYIYISENICKNLYQNC